MEFKSLISNIAFTVFLGVLSYVLTIFMIKRVRILDAPNQRSSHSVPTPRSGGFAILISFFVGLLALRVLSDNPGFQESFFAVFIGAILLIAIVSVVDDLMDLGFKAKLFTQVIATIIVMSFGVVVDRLAFPFVGMVDLGLWGYPLTLIWIVGLTNAFNFMDGIDGLAAGTAIVVGVFFAVITNIEGNIFVYLLCLTLVGACLGFFALNWQPAKIFMGDTGSQFLGFVLAVLSIFAGKFDASHTSYFVMVLLFFHYIWDTGYTLFRRTKNNEKVTQAHRTHLYQLMNALGMSHAQVTLLYLALTILQGLGALVLINVSVPYRALVFLPFIILQLFITMVVTKRARTQGLI